MQQRTGRHHFRVQQRMPREQAVKIAAVTVRPVQHRCDRQFMHRKLLIKLNFSEKTVNGHIIQRAASEFTDTMIQRPNLQS
jgi:hypothetical protein